MKKITFIAVFCVLCRILAAQDVHTKVNQDLIKLTDGTSFFTEIQSVKDGVVTYQKGPQTMNMPQSEVAFIEFKDSGVEYFNKSSLKVIAPENVGFPVYQKGNKVYIPFSSHMVVQRSGALRLRELVAEEKIWEVADCEDEAHFILEMVYSEEGKDHAILNLKNRNGELLYQTPKSKKSDWNDVDKGIEMADDLFEMLDGRHFEENKIDHFNYECGHRELVPYVSPLDRGFIIRPEVGVGFNCVGYYYYKYFGGGASIGPAINSSITFARQFAPKIAVGGGLNMRYSFPIVEQNFYKTLHLGIFVNVRADFRDRRYSPFFDVKLGMSYVNAHYPVRNLVEKKSSGIAGVAEASFGWRFKKFYYCVSAYYAAEFYDDYDMDQIAHNVYHTNFGLSFNLGYNIHFKKKK